MLVVVPAGGGDGSHEGGAQLLRHDEMPPYLPHTAEETERHFCRRPGTMDRGIPPLWRNYQWRAKRPNTGQDVRKSDPGPPAPGMPCRRCGWLPAMRLSAVSSCSSPLARLRSVSAWTGSPFRGVPCRLMQADGVHAGTSGRMAREHRASGRWGAEIGPPSLRGAGRKLPELEACEGRGPGACGHRILPFPRADRRPQRIIPDISGLGIICPPMASIGIP